MPYGVCLPSCSSVWEASAVRVVEMCLLAPSEAAAETEAHFTLLAATLLAPCIIIIVCVCVCLCVCVSSGSLALLALVCFTLVCAGKQGQFLQATKEREKGKKRKKTKRTAGHLTRPFFSHRLGAGGFPFQESQARAMVATASLCAATLMARSTPASLAPSTAAPCAALTVGRTSSTLNTCAVKKKRWREGRGKEGGRKGEGKLT